MDRAVLRICTVCARRGSKGVPNKNLRPLLGKPLLAHSIEQARASALFSAIAVSSDSAEILAAARQAGADHLIERPAELATDTAPKLPAIRHCVSEVERITGCSFDIIVDLDATSPLREPQDIVNAVELLEESKVSNVITGAPARRSPYFNLVEVGPDNIARLCKPPRPQIARRQDAPPCYDMNASIYAWWRPILFGSDSVFNSDTRLYVMPPERSVDIDSDLDFEIVEHLVKKRRGHA